MAVILAQSLDERGADMGTSEGIVLRCSGSADGSSALSSSPGGFVYLGSWTAPPVTTAKHLHWGPWDVSEPVILVSQCDEADIVNRYNSLEE